MMMWDKEFEFSLEEVKKVGLVIKQAFNREKVVSEKSSPTDLVTETDQQVEQLLIKGLSSQFPDYKFIGEESVAGGLKCELTDLPTWVIDPIDGTMNFVHSNQQICTILAFMVDKEVEFSIVYNPILDQLWTARRGQGAFYNNQKINVSSCKSLATALTILPTVARKPVEEEMVNTNVKTFVPKVSGIRGYGSAGLNLAYLAMGSVDLYFEIGFHIWDYAGPSLIVREAGGEVKDVSGNQIDYLARNLIATSSKELMAESVPLLSIYTVEKD